MHAKIEFVTSAFVARALKSPLTAVAPEIRSGVH
jgi:hypothetical protein